MAGARKPLPGRGAPLSGAAGRRRAGVALVLSAALGAARPLLAQQTGRITGAVVDASGLAVAGAAVTATSASLQGTRSTTADERGRFRLAFLPPGAYELKAERPGFRPTTIGVRVDLDRTGAVEIRLDLVTAGETVEVKGRASEVEATSTATGLVVGAELYSRLALDRTFYAVARLAAGTQQDESGTAFYGSTGAENQYVIDGLNVTGTEVGQPSKDLNPEFVDEVEVKTGGLPAEYGRSTGGILNVLTKSGSNELHGAAFGFFAGGALQSDDRTADERPADTTVVEDTTARHDFGASLGGRILRDRLWFFGAWSRVTSDVDVSVIRNLASPGAPAAGDVVEGRNRGSRFAGKLTWRPAVSSTLALSVFGDPRGWTGPVGSVNGPSSTWLGTWEGGGTDVALRYEGTFGRSLLVRALFGEHRDEGVFGGGGTETARVDDYTVVPTASTGGLGSYGDSRSRRRVARLDVSRLVGGHELKAGGDVEAIAGEQQWTVSGGDWIGKLEQDGQVFYWHNAFLDDRAPGFDANDPSTWRPASPVVVAPRTVNLSAYVQDSWRVARGLTVNAGVRFERQDLEGPDGVTRLLVDNWAPRAGVAWDVAADGRGKVYAGFGRYFESIPQKIQLSAFGGDTQAVVFNFDPTPGAFGPDPAAPQPSFVFGGTPTAVVGGLGGQHADEWLLGFERELRRGFVVGVKGAWRRLGRVIEDVNTGDGEHVFANPGEGTATSIALLDGSSAPSPKARRDNYSVELTARRRLSHGFQLLTSYVWTRLEGNYDGSYQRSTGQLAPNWNSAFDVAEWLVNARGRLTSESVHQLKLDGSYELQGRAAGLNLGLSAHWYGGLPQNAYGVSFHSFDWQYYLAARGSVGRQPADYELDLHASYPVRLGGSRARLLVQADLFNTLDRQAVVRYDERYNLVSDGPCAGIPDGLCNGDGGIATRPGTLEPLGSIGDPRLTSTNPDYLTKGKVFTGCRSLRLGARLTF